MLYGWFERERLLGLHSRGWGYSAKYWGFWQWIVEVLRWVCLSRVAWILANPLHLIYDWLAWYWPGPYAQRGLLTALCRLATLESLDALDAVCHLTWSSSQNIRTLSRVYPIDKEVPSIEASENQLPCLSMRVRVFVRHVRKTCGFANGSFSEHRRLTIVSKIRAMVRSTCKDKLHCAMQPPSFVGTRSPLARTPIE